MSDLVVYALGTFGVACGLALIVMVAHDVLEQRANRRALAGRWNRYAPLMDLSAAPTSDEVLRRRFVDGQIDLAEFERRVLEDTDD